MLNRISSWGNPSGTTLLLRFFAAAALIIVGCASGDMPTNGTPAEQVVDVSRSVITAVALNGDAVYLSRSERERCALERHDLSEEGAIESLEQIARCPDRIDILASGEVVLRFSDGVRVIGSNLTKNLLAFAGDDSYVYSDGDSLFWRRQGEDVPLPHLDPGRVMLIDDAVVGVRTAGDDRQVVRLEKGSAENELDESVLVESIGEIDWIAIDDEDVEMVLSTVRDGSDDIAIANLEEPIMNWIPRDPSDEERPRFSPIGYKLSYIIRNPGGDLIRTVHVPTSAMVLVDFPWSVVRDYVWFPDGERLAVALSSPLASDQVVEATYTGSVTRTLVAPDLQFDRDVDRIPGAPPGSILILPSDLGYGDRRPLVIWARSGARSGLEFDPALVPLLERDDVGVVVVNGPLDRLSPAFRDSIAEAPWVDASAIWAVGAEPGTQLPDGVRHVRRESGFDAARWILRQIDREVAQR